MVRHGALFLLFLLLAGCAAVPGTERQSGFAPVAGQNVLYVDPFLTIMTPAAIQEGIFDQFIDILNERGAASGYEFVILKQGVDGVDRNWLRQQQYVTGEIFGYIEDSGCCSTAIRIKSRVRLFQPEHEAAVLKIDYPREIIFDHDLLTIEIERRKLAEDIAVSLAATLLSSISPP